MTRQEYRNRLEGSIAGEKLDHQSVHFFIDAPFCCSVTGVPMKEYYASAQTMMECQLETYDKIGGFGSLYADFGVVAEGSAYGGIVRSDPTGVLALRPSGIETLDDVMKMEPMDLYGDHLVGKSLRIMEYMVQHKPADYDVDTTRVIAPFTTAATLRGISDFCSDIYEDPEMVTALLDLICDDLIRYVREQERILGHPAKYILLADDISSFLSPVTFSKYVKPYYERFWAAFPYAQRWLHNDADAAHLAGSIADAGFQLWHAGSCIDVHKAMADAGNRVSIVGALHPIHVLRDGTPDSVYRTTCDFIRACKGNPKHIVSVGGYVTWDTPIENVKAMIQAADDTAI